MTCERAGLVRCTLGGSPGRLGNESAEHSGSGGFLDANVEPAHGNLVHSTVAHQQIAVARPKSALCSDLCHLALTRAPSPTPTRATPKDSYFVTLAVVEGHRRWRGTATKRTRGLWRSPAALCRHLGSMTGFRWAGKAGAVQSCPSIHQQERHSGVAFHFHTKYGVVLLDTWVPYQVSSIRSMYS